MPLCRNKSVLITPIELPPEAIYIFKVKKSILIIFSEII